MEMLIQNARLFDPSQNRDARSDLLIRGGRIAGIAAAETLGAPAHGRLIDGREWYVFPGFVDFHTHLFAHGSGFGLDADRLIESGVVCAADMGTAGWANYPALHECDLIGKRIELKAYLNLSPVGQPGRGVNEPLDDAVIDVGRMKALMARYPGEIAGVKVRLSRGIVGELRDKPLRRAVKVGEELGLPVCVHTTDLPISGGEAASMLRAGDVYSHIYHGKGTGVLGKDGHVERSVLDAQRRGVLMEVGNGRVNFNFPVARQALADGLYPDIISSDSTPATFHKEGPMWDLAFVASKFLALGLTLSDVIRAITVTPAKALGAEDRFGSITIGREANLVLCRMDDAPTVFRDADGNEMTGPRGLVPMMTIRRGEIVYEAQAIQRKTGRCTS